MDYIMMASYFWRVSEKYAPHNAVISTKNILKVAENNEYRTTSETKTCVELCSR